MIFINGFNLGRYWNVGPQQNYYLPGPLLKQGQNEVSALCDKSLMRPINKTVNLMKLNTYSLPTGMFSSNVGLSLGTLSILGWIGARYKSSYF